MHSAAAKRLMLGRFGFGVCCVCVCFFLKLFFCFVCSSTHADYSTVAVVAVIASTLIGVVLLSVCGVVRCLRATRTASSGALARPIPLLPEDQTPLNAEPEHTVPVSLCVCVCFTFIVQKIAINK